MHVISLPAIKSFVEVHTDASDAMYNWYRAMKKNNFNNYHELKEMFGSVDAVANNRYVFNIKGNKYRIVALIHFKIKTVYIRFVGSHTEYDKVDATTI